MQVHPIQLLGHRHKARLDADASRKTDTLSRGIASDRGHALHHDFFRGSVIEFLCESVSYRTIAALKMYRHRIKNKVSKKEKDNAQHQRKINTTWTCSLSTGNVNCY